MRSIDWVKHRSHRTQVATDSGQWVGLLDEDFIPFLTLPQLIKMDWPETRGAPESVEVSLRVRTPSGRMHRVVDELVAKNLGQTDAAGQLVPISGPARLLAMERPGMTRRVMRISHVEVEGDSYAPYTMTIHGVDLLNYLDMLPCPSKRDTWTGDFTRFTRDWVGPENIEETFEHPRDLADMKMSAVAEGATVDGDADQAIFQIISTSLSAVHQVAGITSDPPYVVVKLPAITNSPYTIVRPTDQTIWAEIGEIALSNGVAVRAGLWWPGDPQPPGLTLALPTVVFTVRQEG